MNSRSGGRVPAGVSGEAGRGAVGTVAPTTPIDPGEFAMWVFSRMLWVAAAAYALIGIAIAWIAFLLAPWGLLLLIVAACVLSAAVLAAWVALGISSVEADFG